MIISASRRTDIPAFYTPWLMNRIAAGYCTVPNPFNRNQVTRVSLLPEEVAAIVFWTRNPRPLLARLDELDARGFRYYFQYTILDYPRALEPKTPPVDAAVRTFRALADRLGPARVIWRYDPIVLSLATDADFHRQRFAAIARQLRGSTQRVVVSVMDHYKKIAGRLQALAAQGIEIPAAPGERWPGFSALMAGSGPLRDGKWHGDRELRRDHRPGALRHPSWALHRRRAHSAPLWRPGGGEQGSQPTGGVRLCGQSRHWDVRFMSVWMPVLLCYEQF